MPEASSSGNNDDESLFIDELLLTDALLFTDEVLSTDEQGFELPDAHADDEFDEYEAPELKLDLEALNDCASKVASTRCVSARRLARGTCHEVFLLHFEPSPDAMVEITTAGNSCIARFTRQEEPVAKATSELATMKYVKDHSSIAVPKIFHQDLRPDNQVGAPFVLMERLPGKPLHKFWNELPLEHKKDVLTQLAQVLTTFATFRFDEIGSLQDHGVGPIIRHFSLPGEQKIFSSTLEWLSAYFRDETMENLEVKDVYSQVRQELEMYFSKTDASYLNAPFRLIHGDFDSQNLLFMKSPDDSDKAPVLSGMIDFEFSYIGPLYYLYEYPIFIQDVNWSPELYEENAILRPHFVRALRKSFSKGSHDASEARDVMRGKNYLLNDIQRIMWLLSLSSDNMKSIASGIRYFLQGLREGTGLAYDGREDYLPDPEPESD